MKIKLLIDFHCAKVSANELCCKGFRCAAPETSKKSIFLNLLAPNRKVLQLIIAYCLLYS